MSLRMEVLSPLSRPRPSPVGEAVFLQPVAPLGIGRFHSKWAPSAATQNAFHPPPGSGGTHPAAVWLYNLEQIPHEWLQ